MNVHYYRLKYNLNINHFETNNYFTENKDEVDKYNDEDHYNFYDNGKMTWYRKKLGLHGT